MRYQQYMYCVLYFYSFYVLAYYILLFYVVLRMYLSTYALRVRNGKIVKYMKVCTWVPSCFIVSEFKKHLLKNSTKISNHIFCCKNGVYIKKLNFFSEFRTHCFMLSIQASSFPILTFINNKIHNVNHFSRIF